MHTRLVGQPCVTLLQQIEQQSTLGQLHRIASAIARKTHRSKRKSARSGEERGSSKGLRQAKKGWCNEASRYESRRGRQYHEDRKSGGHDANIARSKHFGGDIGEQGSSSGGTKRATDEDGCEEPGDVFLQQSER